MSPLCVRTLRLVWLMCLVLGTAAAQPGRPVSQDRVTFYTQPNFRGDSLVVEAGAALPNLERMTRPGGQPWLFAISSIRVEGAARATVYSGVGLTADRLEVTRDLADLYGVPRGREPGATWDRAIASLAVQGPARVVVPPPPPATYAPAPPPNVVVVTPPPPPPPVVHGPALDRRTADLIVYRAFRDVLNRPPDPEGLRTYRDRLMYGGWTERQVVEQLQRSAEARAVNPDEAIRRAYREVLGRDPDANGLAHYRAKWRAGWTQGQIRDDLRRSQEARATHFQAAITRAYREVLGRDPDPEGYANYERLMREKGYSEGDVRAALRSSDEYRQRRGKR